MDFIQTYLKLRIKFENIRLAHDRVHWRTLVLYSKTHEQLILPELSDPAVEEASSSGTICYSTQRNIPQKLYVHQHCYKTSSVEYLKLVNRHSPVGTEEFHGHI